MKDDEFYYPSEEVVKNANIQNYEKVYKEAAKDPVKFWEKAAKDLTWQKKWTKTFDDSKKPFYSWFVNGKCNIFDNALERHQKTATRGKIAILWEGENGDKRKLTYKELYNEVNKFAAVLKNMGVEKGDRVAVYLSNIPEVAITMLACVKIGAIHSVVYAGFSAQALRKRIKDAQAKIVVTVDWSYRRGKVICLKKIVDEALQEDCESISHSIVVNHGKEKVDFSSPRDVWYHELMKKKLPVPKTEVMDAEDPAFILYTSGTTGTPKGVVHAHGGYMVGVYRTIKWVFDLKENDVYWCTADPGWITGHSYIVYGPLMAGVTTIQYEGVPDFPQEDRIWEMVSRYKVNVLYTAPTLIRLMAKYGDDLPAKHDMSSLRILGSVGEPINPEAWKWYYEHIGKNRCPIMDTWWQTETGMNIITPLPPVPLKAGSAYRPFPGIIADVVDKDGKSVEVGKGGFLVIKGSWPAQLKTLYHNPQRYIKTYYDKIPGGMYLTGDLATKDKDGYFWIQGRADDVLSISGHRISNAEIESAIVSHEAVSEAGVIGKPHPVKGEIAKAFVILKSGFKGSEELIKEIKLHIRKTIGPLAVTEEIEFVEKLPKTRSGKIMRRVLRAKELGEELGDTSTLED
ncbi:MAG: acetate--CoA ligase [Candidatus Doudnabacteria bacterium CG10_big_fil_rev_8_21_14_0_10_41_10]|uniref:Acetate--CoA ligase n=1 Tax=Candidatus Doudnabacteria bacterium CG10_big_fil_rev_8_21_14_0_10_41_10 TaxID=1974551 RepID=A0A2H0VE62_9BACT|nr:MAG: acetate--CoA ligase [Candidatus Doudnabacteria bacterium CG10_big_fil_rev_8_21_14_0_10_41_10]